MDFYFVDRQYNLLGIASTERGRFRIAGEVEAQSTTASTVALTGNVYFAKKDLNDAINMCVGEGGNYILYEDDRGVGHFMTVQNTQVDNTGCLINFQADDAGNDLKDEIVGTYTANTAMTFAQYFNAFTYDSGWEIGINEIPSNARTLEFTSEQSSYDRMLEVANDFGVSIYYSFKIDGLEPMHRYMNVVNKLGSDTNVTLRQGTDISQIVSETSTADLHTSIKAYGATPDGASQPLNLAGYKWTDSDGRFELGSDGVLRDTVAIRTWSRYRTNSNPDPTYSHLQMVKTYDANTQATLLQSALADLKTYNHPAVNYTVTMARVPSDVGRGDTVYIEDEDQELYLSATVLEVDKCYSLPSNSSLTLGDFKIEHDQTSVQIKQAAKTAEDAVSKATTAFSYAATVDEKADNAQTTANTAKDNADTAQKTANTAQITATNAAQVAEKAQASADANRTFIKSATTPNTTNLPVNAVWITPATTDSDGNTVAASAKTWDGSNWQDTAIESSLIAENIVGKNITGSTFGNTSGTFSIDEGGNITGASISGSEIKSTFSKSPLDLVANEDNLTGSGNVDIKDGTYSVDGTIDQSTSQTFQNYLGPSGIFTSLSNNGSATNMASLSKGELDLYYHDGSATYTGVIDGQIASQIDNVDRLLWEGTLVMNSMQTVTPSLSIDQCLHGWMLLWSQASNGSPVNSRFIYQPILKSFAVNHYGQGLTFPIAAPVDVNTPWGNNVAKYVYANATTIYGYDANYKGTSFAYALREVRAF